MTRYIPISLLSIIALKGLFVNTNSADGIIAIAICLAYGVTEYLERVKVKQDLHKEVDALQKKHAELSELVESYRKHNEEVRNYVTAQKMSTNKISNANNPFQPFAPKF